MYLRFLRPSRTLYERLLKARSTGGLLGRWVRPLGWLGTTVTFTDPFLEDTSLTLASLSILLPPSHNSASTSTFIFDTAITQDHHSNTRTLRRYVRLALLYLTHIIDRLYTGLWVCECVRWSEWLDVDWVVTSIGTRQRNAICPGTGKRSYVLVYTYDYVCV